MAFREGVRMTFKKLLYNPPYGSGYAGSYFPVWVYSKYFGMPVYKWCRRKGASKYFSYMGANLLGSLLHVVPYIYVLDISVWYLLPLNMVVFTSLFYISRLRLKRYIKSKYY